MFEKLTDAIRNWLRDPEVDKKVNDLEKTISAWHDKTYTKLGQFSNRIDVVSDGIDKNGMFFNEKMRDIVDLRMRIEYLERRLKGDLFKLTTNEVAVAKKLGIPLENYAKHKLELMCNPPAPIKRGRKLGSKNKPKPVPVEVKPARKPRTKKDKGQ
jgi:hypothetical protein